MEDDEQISRTIGKALEGDGHEVHYSTCGITGLEMVHSIKPDITLIDALLPGINGIEVCRSLKDDPDYKSVHILMMTELGDHESAIRGFTAGANDCVSKPFNLKELLARVKSHLRMKDFHDLLTNEKDEKSILLDVSQVLSSTVDPFENLYTIVSRIADAIDVNRCSIIYLDTTNKKGYVMASHDSKEVQRLEIDLVRYPEIQKIMDTRRQVIVYDVEKDPIFASVQDFLGRLEVKSILAFPIFFRDILIGTLLLRTSRTESYFNEREIRFCEVISHLAASPLKSAYLFEILHSEKEEEKGKRVAAEDQLQLASKVFENAIEGVMITGADGVIQSVNPAFTTITGFTQEEALGKTPRILKSDRHEPVFFECLWKSLTDTGRWQGEVWNRRKNGEAYAQWLTVTANKDFQGRTKHYVGVFHEISEKLQDEEQTRYRENHDALTGLPNKSLFIDRLERSVIHASRNQIILAVMFLDLDHFKKINEGFGHPKGDILLQGVAERLKGLIREGDTMARWGGDDFTFILEDVKNAEGTAKVAGKIIKSFSEPFFLDGLEINITGSIGIALYPANGEDAQTLIKNADHALYRGKEMGRNYYQMFTPAMNTITSERLELENQLRKALDRKEFLVYYQPKVDLRTGEIVGMEALARWKHPQKGFISPGVFIPLAEESGLIAPLGKWVLHEACRQTKEWLDAGYSSVRVAVNLSAVQFHRQNILKKVRAVLDETGLDPKYLDLEITEGLVMQNVESAISIMKELVDMGVTLSMDDFGTGYSSLGYLKKFPIDSLKIDRSFVGDIATDHDAAAIASAIISLGHSLNLKVIAEGAETEDHIRFLRKHKCDMVQGYVFSPPVPGNDFTKFLESGKRMVVN
jgi:diguanylate cyclase (GGDEF)-like protein/PAS domain S-box-containing protein